MEERVINDLADYQAIAGAHIEETLAILRQVREECGGFDLLRELLAKRPPGFLDNAAAPLAFAVGLSSQDRLTPQFVELFATVLIQWHQFEELLFNLSYASDHPQYRSAPCCQKMLEINRQWNMVLGKLQEVQKQR